ncbi:LEF3 [Orgyia pseudotsugata single capsid nuclopolyhedrovirus]|nr:LEF3 [Orgyia pseudotsugata single capsid nuclopolyhedrovirus]
MSSYYENCNDDAVDNDNVVEKFELRKPNPKRKLNFNSESDDEDVITETKRLKLNEKTKAPTKKNEITASDTAGVKRNFKTFTGELLTKNMMSINNETYYLFKFLTDNISKEYYGNAGQYQGMRVNRVYEINLDYENKKICIGTYKECKNKDNSVRVQKHLTCSNFDSGDTVSVHARLKCGFKLLDNDNYKIVLHVPMSADEDSAFDVNPIEIECTGNLKKFMAAIRDAEIVDGAELLAYFNENIDKTLKLQRVKCNQTNGALKSLMVLSITQINVDADTNMSFGVSVDARNVSRMNKQILKGHVATLQAEIVTSQNNERVVMSFNLKNTHEDDKMIRASFFNNSYGNNHPKNLHILEANLNQLNELIENNFAHAYIYVTHDNKNNYNVLGITKHDIESNLYESL